MALIELQNIHKKYQLGLQEVEALKGISLKIEKGEFVSIAGPSGSGKSTILNILGLIDMPNSGTIFMNDERVFSEKEQQYYIKTGKLSKSADGKICKIRKNNIGFIFQNFNLLPVLNVYENIEYPLHLGGSTAKSMSKSEKKDWIMYLIEKVGCGCCVANADKNIKKVANEFTDSNENKGVEHLINKYFKSV